MTQRSPPKGGAEAGVDIRSRLLALVVTPANARDRAQIEALITAVPTVVGQSVE